VRSWKRGNVMKHDRTWTKLARDRAAPLQPVAAVAATTMGGDPYGAAQPFTPTMSSTLDAIASKLGEGRNLVKSVWDYVDVKDDDDKTRITKSLLAGYKADGVEGLKRAAYSLEANGISKQMLSSVLKGAIRDGVLGNQKLVFKGYDATTLGMYADDLRLGR
jgi:hypothetical protein